MRVKDFLERIEKWKSVALEPEKSKGLIEFLRERLAPLGDDNYHRKDLCNRSLKSLPDYHEAHPDCKIDGMAILKSNLLYRLIYLKESLRTTPCKDHGGTYEGWGEYEIDEKTGVSLVECECQVLESGKVWNNLTGWLPNNIEEIRASGKIKVVEGDFPE
jgi:hypothetical protein